MKSIAFCLIGVITLFSSCQSKTGTGILIGAGIGATSGAIITGSAGGALVGGALGAFGGGIIGVALDHKDRTILEKNSPRILRRIDRGEQLTLNDIKELSQNGLSPNVIIDQIDSTNSVFCLSEADVCDLENADLSPQVINYMIETTR